VVVVEVVVVIRLELVETLVDDVEEDPTVAIAWRALIAPVTAALLVNAIPGWFSLL
jgi:hypothetical protein